MKPLSLTLPDDVRDALNHALSEAAILSDDNERNIACVKAVQRILFNEHENDDWKNDFQAKLIGMQTGDAAPALFIENMPNHRGTLFAQALMSILDSDVRKEPYYNSRTDTVRLEFHQDSGFTPIFCRKYIRSLYCAEPGSAPQPTTFITADEVIHAHVCEQMGYRADTPFETIPGDRATYEALKEMYIEQLKSVAIPIKSGGGIIEYFPFLSINPNYTASNGAPQYMINYPDETEGEVELSNPANNALKENFMTTAEKLQTRAAEESKASTKHHSMVIWNDAMVFHARPLARGQDHTVLRQVHSRSSFPQYVPEEETERKDAPFVGYATGGPCARLDLTTPAQLDGALAEARKAAQASK